VKHVFLFVSLISLFIAACAPRQTVIATGVSSTLTAMAPTAILPADRPTSTSVPTLAPPTATSLPTETPPLPTVAATEGPPPTDTPVAGTVGELIFEDTFDNPGPWAVGDSGDSNVAVSGGVMSFAQKMPGSFSFRVIGRQGADFYAEVTGALAKNCGSGDFYGLMFRIQDASNYYAFQIDCDGRYRFARYVGGAKTAIVDWTGTSAINRGAQANNTLAVTARGSTFQFAVNGTPLATADDTAFASGRFGLMVGSNVTKNFTVLFDNLRANKVP
jgi:hypothetical protein